MNDMSRIRIEPAPLAVEPARAQKSKGFKLSRRSFLRGAGALLGLPFLEGLTPLVAAEQGRPAKPPLRLGIFTVTGGTVLESWKPAAEGKLGKLPSILRPLEFARDDILVLSGLAQNGRSEGLNAHEHCALLHLTGTDFVRKEGGKARAAVSVDQAAAKAVGELSARNAATSSCVGGSPVRS